MPLSEEEFRRRYGLSPDDVINGLSAQPPVQSTAVPVAPVPAAPTPVPQIAEPTTVSRERPPAPDAGNPFFDSLERSVPGMLVGRIPDTLTAAVTGQDPQAVYDRNKQERIRFLRNVGSGIAQIPGDVPMLYGLAGAGAGYVKDKVEGKPTTFVDHMFGEGGQERVMSTLKSVSDVYKKLNPQATPQDLQAVQDQYQNSDDFQKLIAENLRPGLSLGTIMQQYANKLVGMDRMPDEQQSIDDIEQIIGSAAIGLPKAVVESVSRAVLKGAARKAMSSLPGRIVAHGAELVTPGTFPLTGPNAAANIGVGAAMNQGVRYATNQTTLADDIASSDPAHVPNMLQPDAVPQTLPGTQEHVDDDGHDVPAHKEAVSLGVLGPLFAGLLGYNAGTIGKVVTTAFRRAGPTLEQQAAAATNLAKNTGISTDAKAIIDNHARVLDTVRGVAPPDVVDAVEADLGMRTGASGEIGVQTALNHGILDGLPGRGTSNVDLRRMYSALKPDEQELFNDYVFAKQAQKDRENQFTDYTKELMNKQLELQQAQTTGANRAKVADLQQAVQDLTSKLQRSNADLRGPTADTAIRPSLQDWDTPTLLAKIQAGENNPNVKALADLYGPANHRLLDYQVAMGHMDPAVAAELKQRYPIHIKLEEDPFGATQGLQRVGAIWGSKIKDALRGFDDNLGRDTSVRGMIKSRSLEADKTLKVNNPINTLDAHDLETRRVVREVQANDVRRGIIDTIKQHPGGAQIMRQEKIGNTLQFTDAQLRAADNIPGLRQILDNKDGRYTAIRRAGKTEFYSFADPNMARALEFAPAATFPISNILRKTWQKGTTGIAAPWFATKALLWDQQSGQMLKRPGRSFGMADTLLRRLSKEHQYANDVLDKTVDPTAYLQTLSAVPRQMAWYTYGKLGEKIKSDLLTNSGFFKYVVQAGMMSEPQLQKMSANMIRAYDQSAVGIFNHHIGHGMHLADPTTLKTEFDRVLPTIKVPGVSQAVGAYSAMLASMHQAAKYAFFSQNYSRLYSKHGGNIPHVELQKLLNEARQMSGDMSRTGSSDAYNKVASVSPYMNAAVQASRFTYQELISHPSNVVPRVLQGAILPAAAGAYMMSNWDDASREYWWNQLPTWERISNVPVPTIDTLTAWAQGKHVPFSPKAVHLVSLSPDFIPITQSFLAGLEAMGVGESSGMIKGNKVPMSAWHDFATGLGTMLSLQLPPVVQAGLAVGGQKGDMTKLLTGQGLTTDMRDPTFSGASADKMNVNSNVPRVLNDVFGALFGAASQIGLQMSDAYMVDREHGAKFTDAAKQALDEGWRNARDKGADLPYTGVWGADKKLYKGTPVAEAVWNFNSQIDPVLKQASVESDKQGRQPQIAAMGAQPIPTISDPLIKQMVDDTASTFNKGQFAAQGKQITNMNAMLTAIDGSKASLNYEQRNQNRLAALRNVQLAQEQQYAVIKQWQAQMTSKYGDQFKQRFGTDFSPKAFVAAVKASLQSQATSQ